MKKALAFVLTAVFLLGLAACGKGTPEASQPGTPSSATAAQPAEKKPLIIGITQWPGSYVWYGVEKSGIFEKNGVKAEIRMFPVYSDGMNALIAGNIDAYLLSYSDALAPWLGGADIRLVMVEDYSAGSDGLVAKPGIKTVADLKGKKVATEIGTVDQMFLNKCLEENGMTEEDIDLVNMSIGDAGNAFIAGQVDAAAIWDPSLSMAVDSGGVLLSTTKEFPGLIPAIMAVYGPTLDSRRDDIKAAVKSWFDGLAEMEANYETFVGYVAEGAEISAEDFETMMAGVRLVDLEGNVPAFARSEDYVSLQYCGLEHAAFLEKVGMIDKAPDSVEDLLDGSIIQELAEK